MKKKLKKKSHILEWTEAFLIALVVVILFRTFAFDLFVVPTTSMDKTIQSGDFILVNKYDYGARMPNTPLSVPFFHQKMEFLGDVNSYLDNIQLPYYRFPSFDTVQRNDVVVFNYPLESEHPVDQRSFYVKRCIGLPGDRLSISRKVLSVNGVKEEQIPDYQFNYHVRISKNVKYDELFDILEISEGRSVSNQGDWQLTMPLSSIEKLEENEFVENIVPLIERKYKYQDYIFPYSKDYPWNKDNYGEIRIPKKGDTIFLSTVNIVLYEKLITDYEYNKVEVEDTLIFINNTIAEYFVPKLNYYFMMGDNRDNSTDSRFWGFVPEDHIVGKASSIFFSVDKKSNSFFKRFRWNRFFSSIE